MIEQDPYTKGRLVGIGEGMALASITAEAADRDTLRARLGMAESKGA
jgi:hypothetical protein